MSLLDQHDQYMARAPQWKRGRDVIEGQDAVHSGKEVYLPRLDGQNDKQYDSYRHRARFFNASDRTVRGMIGLVTRKETRVEPDDTEYEDDVSHNGTSMGEYAQDVLEQLLVTGRAGTLLDYPTEIEAQTVAQAEALGATPMMAMYVAEAIIDWNYKFINNKYQLIRVFLFDGVDSQDSDNLKYHYRELLLEEGVYTQRLYVGNDISAEPQLVNEIIPKMNGSVLRAIPFEFHGITAR
ncbi:MAG: hypothetical protein DRR06_17765, partial [Gammaproteobacteria bacterium]